MTVTKILNIARSQLGYREASGNRNKYGRWYGMDRVPWCNIFISWIGVQANARDIVGRAAYTPSHANWFRSQGRWGTTPRRGAIVFFDFPDSVRRIQHVGIVESVRSDGRIVTIEGNTSAGWGSQSNGGGVYRRVRATNVVVGYGYPDYSSERNVKVVATQSAARSNVRPPLTVDGVWGRNTTRALQRWIGVQDDGQIGPDTRKGLQKKLGVILKRDIAVDGSWGRVTRKSLQRALKVEIDGQWGKVTIRALQRTLNSDWRR